MDYRHLQKPILIASRSMNGGRASQATGWCSKDGQGPLRVEARPFTPRQRRRQMRHCHKMHGDWSGKIETCLSGQLSKNASPHGWIGVVQGKGSPTRSLKGKQAHSYYIETENQSASSKQRVPSSLTTFTVDLRHTLNAKRRRGDGYLRAKLVARAVTAARINVLVKSEVRTSYSTLNVTRY